MNLTPRIALLGLCALVLLPASLRALDPSKSIFQFNCRNWTRLSGLPADRITAVVQDQTGYIWLGSQNGLIRYDGRSFTLVPIVGLASARGTHVSSLGLAGNGILWFSIHQGGYGGFDGEKFVEFGDKDWKLDVDSSTLATAKNGSLWIGSVSGWGRWAAGDAKDSLPMRGLDTVTAIMEEPSGRAWFGSTMAGLFFLEAGVLHELPDPEIKTTIIQAIVRDEDNDLWVGTSGGLFRYDAQLRRKAVYFSESQTTALLVDRQGVLWIGTGGTGLHRFHRGVFSHLGKNDGLGSDVITCLGEDKEGSLWIGTVEGLSQLSDLKFPILSAAEGLIPGSAVCVAASPKGGFWVGTDRGASYYDGVRSFNIDPSILVNRYVRRVFVAANGDVYLGDGSRNIAVLRDDKVIARFSHEYWPEAFLDDGNGVIVAFGFLLFRIEGARMEPYVLESPAPVFGWINDLARGKNGEIWAATNAGLFKIEGKKVRQLSQADGLNAARIYCIRSDPDGGLWAGTQTGLLRIKGDQVVQVGTKDGLADSRIFAMMLDEHGSLWLSSGRGILRISTKNVADFADGKVSQIHCETFDGLDSVKVVDRTDQGHSACRTSDGRVWFPTARGVLMIDPSGYFTNRVPPRVRIERVKVRDRDLALHTAVELKTGDRNIEFFFAVLSFIASEKTHVSYRLEGFDSAWIDGSTHRSVNYNNLPAGKYVFQVKAANADGVWSVKNDEFGFTLPSPFYKRPWFYFLCALTAGLGLYAGYQIKVRHMRRSQSRLQSANDALEAKIGQRTSELASSVSLLQATLNSTADGIVAINDSGQVVSYNLQFEQLWPTTPGFMSRVDDAELRRFLATQVKVPEQFLSRLGEIQAAGEGEAFDVIELADGRIFERYCRPQLESAKRVGIVMNYRDVTQRKQAQNKLDEAHRQLLANSRLAGMADVASSVLHNVGNVLNSVNVSATMVSEHVRDSKVGQLARLANLFETHAGNLATFLTEDPKGQKIVPYFSTLSQAIFSEQKIITAELASLCKNVEHIKEVVAMQQRFARVSGVSEVVATKDLFEDALRMNLTTLTEHELSVVREYQATPPITIDRHKALQILINLVSNAKQACDNSPLTDKKVIVRITEENTRVKFSVIDNGVGIPKENLTRIFSNGFTTKKDGHGFGLHSSALTAKELGGTLTAQSDGAGLGATFILDLPR